MCGIFGWISSKNQRPDRSLVEAANDSMLLRGPDSAGYELHGRVALAARRLAVLDLATGNQPIVTKCGRAAVVQNGEIYNFAELRKSLLARGHKFASKGDTEVLGCGFVEWGIEGLLKRIDGMYAFAIHDRKSSIIHIARDRFGEKPLFYWHAKGEFIFASQLLTIARHPSIDWTLNGTSVEAYLALGFVPGEETLLSPIRKLKPGHLMSYRLEQDSLEVRSYWSLKPVSAPVEKSSDSLVRHLRYQLDAAVASRLVSDVPVGAFLSGGIDSSALVACMASRSSKVQTFSLGFREPALDEAPYAKLVSRHFGTEHHEIVLTHQDIKNLLEDVVVAMDEPIADQAAIPTLMLSRLARRSVTVALSGEGADEIFGGYGYYHSRLPLPGPRSVVYAGLRRYLSPNRSLCEPISLRDCTTPSGFPLIFGPQDLKAVLRGGLSFNATPWGSAFADQVSAIFDPLQAARYSDIVSWLPDNLLVKLDKMAMAASLESRCPYLTPTLVEWAFGLPQSLLVETRNNSKTLLRQAYADLLPRQITARKKRGFIMPLDDFFKADGRALLQDALDIVVDEAVINNSKLRQIIEQGLDQKKPPGRLLFAVLIFKLWISLATRLPKFRGVEKPHVRSKDQTVKRSGRRTTSLPRQRELPRNTALT